MKVLVAYERSGVVRRAFAARGHHAVSCDLEAAEDGGWHVVGDALAVVAARGWDLVIAHPPCTYLSVSGVHWNARRPERATLTEQALEHVRELMRRLFDSGARWCIENPVGLIGSWIRPADQWVQPYEFGEDASKKTGLWLSSGLPPLRPGTRVRGRLVCLLRPCLPPVRPDDPMWSDALRYGCRKCGGKLVERWSNQSDSGQNLEPDTKRQAENRARTYPGIARAMAEQWGALV